MADARLKQQNSFLSKEERKEAVLRAQQAKERMFKLMVKIISWESGSSGSVVIQSANKITSEEWSEYKKQRMGISTPFDQDKAKSKLTKTYNLIKANGGFK